MAPRLRFSLSGLEVDGGEIEDELRQVVAQYKRDYDKQNIKQTFLTFADQIVEPD